MVKKIVFIFDDKDIHSFLEKNEIQKDSLIVCNKNEIREKISKMNLNCKLITEYRLSNEQKIKSLKWIKEWSNIKIENGKNIKEILEYSGTSLYPYIESRLYHKKIQGLITLIEQIKNVFSQEIPEKVWLIGNADLSHIVTHIHGNLEGSIIIKHTNSQTSEESNSGFLLWKLLLLKIFRGLFSNKKIKNKKSILVISELGSWRKTFNISKNEYEFQDVFFQNIIKKLKEKEKKIEIIDFENKQNRLFSSYSINKKRADVFNCTVEPWEKFLSLKIILKSYSNHKKFKKIWSKLKNSKKFQESLKVGNISIFELVKEDFEGLFNSFKALAAISMIDTTQKIIEQKMPSTIVMHDEYGALQYSFLNVAKEKSIPTLSIQHGEIGDNVFAYTHSNEDITNDVKFFLPNKMCVWSENIKKSLVNSGKFSSDIIKVTGDPKNDYLKYVLNDFDRKNILKEINVPVDKKIIFFATENLTDLDERKQIAEAIIKSMLDLKQFFLIIKMHPNETNVELYQKIINELKISEYKILSDYDIHKLLFISDIVLINHSTVGLEAMRLLKPVISVNLMGLHDETTMINNEFVIEVRKAEELKSAIINGIKSIKQEEIINAKKFAEKILGEIDGNAADRIVNEIIDCDDNSGLKNE